MTPADLDNDWWHVLSKRVCTLEVVLAGFYCAE